MARIAFFGTPEFSVPCLEIVHRFCTQNDHELVLVVSQKDKAQGRGKIVQAPPVKKRAEQLGILIKQPETLRKDTLDGDDFYRLFRSLDLDIAVVVAYGKIITPRLLKIPSRGFINVHASLLPRFRGAAPIQRAIESGDRQTGVCVMNMVKGLDEGEVYAKKITPIIASDTSATLFRRLSRLGATVLYENLTAILLGKQEKQAQSSEGVVYASMLTKSEAQLDFDQSAQLIRRKVQAFDPWPGTHAYLRNKRIKFFDSFAITDHRAKQELAPGTVVVAEKFLGVKARDGVVYFKKIQVEGKKILSISDALRGFAIAPGEKFSREN